MYQCSNVTCSSPLISFYQWNASDFIHTNKQLSQCFVCIKVVHVLLNISFYLIFWKKKNSQESTQLKEVKSSYQSVKNYQCWSYKYITFPWLFECMSSDDFRTLNALYCNNVFIEIDTHVFVLFRKSCIFVIEISMLSELLFVICIIFLTK